MDRKINKVASASGSYYKEEDIKKMSIEDILKLMVDESSHQDVLNIVRTSVSEYKTKKQHN